MSISLINSGYDFRSNEIVAVSGYEPWSKRTLDSIRESLANNIPILARVHSAADYPCTNYQDATHLDMESHAVLIIGYDDTLEEFTVMDPWKKEWGGEYGGIETLPYSIVHKILVNCTMDKCTRIAPLDVKVSSILREDKPFVSVKIGFYTPRGYILDQKETAFSMFNIKVASKHGSIDMERTIRGHWTIGEYAELYFPVSSINYADDCVNVSIKGKLTGNRPYKYTDDIDYECEANIHIRNKEYLPLVATK